jgi:hypothetical protein
VALSPRPVHWFGTVVSRKILWPTSSTCVYVSWTFAASPSDILRTSTSLPLPPKPAGVAVQPLESRHDAAWWAAKTARFDFRSEDRIHPQASNRILWQGLMGDRPYPERPRGKRD